MMFESRDGGFIKDVAKVSNSLLQVETEGIKGRRGRVDQYTGNTLPLKNPIYPILKKYWLGDGRV
jgi:hypothetical protein